MRKLQTMPLNYRGSSAASPPARQSPTDLPLWYPQPSAPPRLLPARRSNATLPRGNHFNIFQVLISFIMAIFLSNKNALIHHLCTPVCWTGDCFLAFQPVRLSKFSQEWAVFSGHLVSSHLISYSQGHTIGTPKNLHILASVLSQHRVFICGQTVTNTLPPGLSCLPELFLSLLHVKELTDTNGGLNLPHQKLKVIFIWSRKRQKETLSVLKYNDLRG